MNKLLLLFTIICLTLSCKNSGQRVETAVEEDEIPSTFFPVTDFLKGEVKALKERGINPLKIVTANNKMDSTWLKMEALDSAFAEFTKTEIDSAAMMPYFKESRFLDQTINTFTFTYSPKAALPSGMLVKRWDIYVNPETGRVKRLYIEKYGPDQKDIQLSWEGTKSCRIVYMDTDKSGNTKVSREELIKWNFDEE
ncbi:MAG: hypothetical protein EOO13_02265 [Chitinophagaceae bacterium]|nr:MAG: hypothetical protein EOO13_02265 [Chitinophagaceae bacterium]